MSIRMPLFGLAFCLMLEAACSSNPDLMYEPPGWSDKDPHASKKGIVSISFLKSHYNGAPRRIVEDVSIRGVVVANDERSAYYKALVVEDATGGIEMKLDHTSLHTAYRLGMTVTVRCNGLTLGDYGGLLQLGWASSDKRYETASVPRSQIPNYVVITDRPEISLLPTQLAIPRLSGRYLSCLVAFDEVQFAQEELGRRYTESNFDTDRHVVDAAGDTLIVRTASRAAFASSRLPEGSGYIEGILGYFNGKYQLTVTNDARAVMGDPRF